MEFYRKKYQLPMLYLIGFGTGILYANFIAKNYITMTGILLWTGFAAGILSVAAVLRMGLCGMLLCIAGIFPQYIFYVPAYLLLIRYYYRYPQSEWNGTKTGFTVMMIVAGILSEVYLNPGIVRWFVKVLT